MKRTLLAAVAALVLAATAPARAEPPLYSQVGVSVEGTRTQIITNMQMLDPGDSDYLKKWEAFCSGFVVYSKGTDAYVVTARHCTIPEDIVNPFNGNVDGTDNPMPFRVRFRDGDVGVVKSIYRSPAYDDAILHVTTLRKHPYARLTDDFRQNEDLVVFGMPLGFEFAVARAYAMQGTVAAGLYFTGEDLKTPWQNTYEVSCPSCGPGISGGGVFDPAGRVVGILVAGSDAASFIVPASAIRRDLNYFVDHPDKGLPPVTPQPVEEVP